MKDVDRDWLTSLQDEIWEYAHPTARNGIGWWSEVRALTSEEWSRLKTLFEENDFLFELGTMFGFSLQLNVLECETYPGTGPSFLLMLSQKQLPKEEGTQEAAKGGASVSWENAWNIFTKYTHSDRNAEKLKFHKREAPKEASYYMY